MTVNAYKSRTPTHLTPTDAPRNDAWIAAARVDGREASRGNATPPAEENEG
jgi:hypothetical protein